jgi:colanic acid/amylovoran biosynthesis glycosyltransferase
MRTVIYYKAGSYLAGSYLPITETWIYGQIKNLKKYRPIVYASRKENLDIYPIENIRSLDLKPGISNLHNFFNKGWNEVFHFYPSFIFYLIKDKPNLVHAHFGPSGYSFLKLKKIFRLPLITTFYGYDLSLLPNQYPEWKRKYRKLFREGELFLVEGNHMKRCLIELGCPEGKIIVQHLGIDLERIKFIPRKLGKDEEINMLISSSFTEKKGIPYAVEAFGLVKQKNPKLKLKLTIIGDLQGDTTGEIEKKKILDIIKKYNLKDYVDMLGYQPYPVFLRELYNHHIFLHPSIHASTGDTEGGAPVSIIEASASGMPILSTTHCDIPEVVKDGESGYLVAERDVNALAERLEFLVLYSGIWEQIGKKGRAHIEKNYDIKKQVQKLEEIYDKVLMET